MNIQIPDFSQVRVLIVGDLMLDRYWSGATSRISPEAPVPVVKIAETKILPGGAGNVALNTAALGCQTTVMGVIGNDDMGQKLTQLLTGKKINCQLQQSSNAATITKLRVLSQHQQLIRLDFEDSAQHFAEQSLIEPFRQALAATDIVILSDYNKGSLAQAQELIQLAREAKVPVFVDPKADSLAAYSGATLVTPNVKEFTQMAGHWQTDAQLDALAQQQLQQHDIETLLVTRSEKGMSLLQREQIPAHIPTKAKDVFDVTGAGDTVIATLAASYAAGVDLQHAMALANLAAGIVVGKLGSATVSVPELRRALHAEHLSGESVVSEAQLLLLRGDARSHQETVVMTNGCFDFIHAGHIAYLERAKALGDKLIIAVNDDASVQRLKGNSRPISPLAHRMAVLAALKPVDYVVPFSEDTPARLISEILPDVLVKGGDYQVDEIAGGDAVLANGGRVEVLNFEEGCSSTRIIEKIRSGL